MITGKQRAYLRSLANSLKPSIQIGKGGINENLIKELDQALELKELVKANVLKNSIESASEICAKASKETGSEIVQVIGNKFVLYRESKENKTIDI